MRTLTSRMAGWRPGACGSIAKWTDWYGQELLSVTRLVLPVDQLSHW
jgi:hypothetical protein